MPDTLCASCITFNTEFLVRKDLTQTVLKRFKAVCVRLFLTKNYVLNVTQFELDQCNTNNVLLEPLNTTFALKALNTNFVLNCVKCV